MAEKSPDSLKASISSFFSNKDIINKEIYKGIRNASFLSGDEPEKIYLSLFSPESCRNSQNRPIDSEESRQTEMSLLPGGGQNGPTDSDELRQNINIENSPDFVATPSLAGQLAEADRREAEEEARKITPTSSNDDGEAAAFLKTTANVALVLVARDLKRFTCPPLANKAGKTLSDTLRFLKEARALGLAEVVVKGNRREDRQDLWCWREDSPARAGMVNPGVSD